jgi:hypothetical protein
LPGFVRKDKQRHEVTRLRRSFSNATLLQPPHQAFHGIAEGRPLGADSFRKGRQTLGQRGVHVTALLEHVLERR